MKSELAAMEWKKRDQCRGVIVHEDVPTASRATRLWNEIVHDMGQGIRCNATFQPTEVIKGVLDFKQADATDIVIISVHDLARFLFTAAAWLDDWLATRSRLPRALFVLHDGHINSPVLQFLQTISGFAGVTLFNRHCETDSPPRGNTGKDRRPVEDMAFVA